METVLWSVDSLDWKLQDTDRIVQRVLKDTEDGDIILMHDEFQTSVEAAMEIIDNLLAKGYTCLLYTSWSTGWSFLSLRT